MVNFKMYHKRDACGSGGYNYFKDGNIRSKEIGVYIQTKDLKAKYPIGQFNIYNRLGKRIGIVDYDKIVKIKFSQVIQQIKEHDPSLQKVYCEFKKGTLYPFWHLQYYSEKNRSMMDAKMNADNGKLKLSKFSFVE